MKGGPPKKLDKSWTIIVLVIRPPKNPDNSWTKLVPEILDKPALSGSLSPRYFGRDGRSSLISRVDCGVRKLRFLITKQVGRWIVWWLCGVSKSGENCIDSLEMWGRNWARRLEKLTQYRRPCG